MFWTLFNEIDRLRAEEMADWLPVHLAAAGGSARELYDGLRQRVGMPLGFVLGEEPGKVPELTDKARAWLRARFG